ncbi:MULTISPECIES: ABC-type transport auxiliary lipoprotein family protein [Paraburkholderia]|uniref:ABC-type transport auxiliary lipoprotein family protein n=1 Tax=Paraburkholderia TaxID=1822464 RepID=UPI00036EFB48|nr:MULTISPECIES: ABC-type transport auxiliary lipoprotein family protein [Paraburkholderia]MDH6153713.1 cholesterol transport system auxiliary component [Paraburkholderia sp. WSM4179]
MKIDKGRATFIALCVVAFSACTLFSPVKMDMKKYVLENIPLDLPSEQTHPATLLVLIPEAEPIYATTQMAYTTQAHQIAYFSQNEWAETPPRMIQPLIVETLRQTRYFSDVLSAPHFGHHTFVLHTEILTLKQDFTSDPAILQFAMRVSLSLEATNQVIATRELSVRVPMRDGNAAAGVAAANEAMAKLLRELASLVVEKAH